MQAQATSLAERLDAIFRDHKDCGFALYAYKPGEPVVFEVLTPEGDTYSFRAMTALEAVNLAFPPPADAPDIFG